MAKNEAGGYRKILANELPRAEQERLRTALQQDLTNALIKSIKADSTDVDLSEVELVLRPGQEVSGWSITADCGTCGTCVTCITCITT